MKIQFVLATVLCAPYMVLAQGYLEIPVARSTESGIGLISGWHCTAKEVTALVDGVVLGKSGVGSIRADTADICGHPNTGFSLLYNYNTLEAGSHSIKVYADGRLIETRGFSTVRSGGVPFLQGVSRTIDLDGFPSPGQSARIIWSEAKQAFVVISMSGNAVSEAVVESRSSPVGNLENPQIGSVESGIGLVSGWHCFAREVTVSIDGIQLGRSGVGSIREDTKPVCGHDKTGFSLLYNYNLLPPGQHEISVFADGLLMDRRLFRSVQSGGVPFLEGVEASYTLQDFPENGLVTFIRWSQAKQAFVVTGSSGAPSGISEVGTFPTFDRKTRWNAISFLEVGDFNGDGLEDLLVVGRVTSAGARPDRPVDHPNYKVNLITQSSDGVFELDTARLLSPGDDLIVGTEPAVVIHDFNKDGVDDFFVGGGTDTNYRVDSFFYLSRAEGGFSRQRVSTRKWIHGVTSADIDGDGVHEIFTAGYDPVHHYLKYRDGRLIVRDIVGEDGITPIYGGSHITVGKFVDKHGFHAIRTDDGMGDKRTVLYSIAEDVSGNLRLRFVKHLPPGRFELPIWDHLKIDPSAGFRSHDVRTFNRDLDGDGRLDAVVLSWPWHDENGRWIFKSELQFLMNKGNGSFVDETESRRFGFDTSLASAHYLRFIDVNGDGCEDIYLDGHSFDGLVAKRVLLNDCAGHFSQAGRAAFTEWVDELDARLVNSFAPSSKSSATTIVRGGNGSLYVVGLIYPGGDIDDNFDSDWKASVFSKLLTPNFYALD